MPSNYRFTVYARIHRTQWHTRRQKDEAIVKNSRQMVEEPTHDTVSVCLSEVVRVAGAGCCCCCCCNTIQFNFPIANFLHMCMSVGNERLAFIHICIALSAQICHYVGTRVHGTMPWPAIQPANFRFDCNSKAREMNREQKLTRAL